MVNQTQTWPKLSEAAAQAVDPSLDKSKNAVDFGLTTIVRTNLRRLLNGQKVQDMWLDDEIINFYFARLIDKPIATRASQKFVVSIHNFSNLPNREHCVSKDKVFDKDIVLILISKNHHWVCVTFYP